MSESEFEKELRSLRPAEPSARLAERITRELRADAPAAMCGPRSGMIGGREGAGFFAKVIHALGWATAGAAATVLTFIAIRPAAPTPQTADAQPPQIHGAPIASVDTDRELISATEEDLLFDAADDPARRLRFYYLERHSWTDAETGARIEFEVPREDIVLMPVAMQ